jgi:hypothetical protein
MANFLLIAAFLVLLSGIIWGMIMAPPLPVPDLHDVRQEERLLTAETREWEAQAPERPEITSVSSWLRWQIAKEAHSLDRPESLEDWTHRNAW